MVNYLVDPTKDKVIDSNPRFINCDAETVFFVSDADDRKAKGKDEKLDAHDLTALAVRLKRQGTAEDEVCVVLSQQAAHGWHITHAMRGYMAAEPKLKSAYLPEGMEKGELDNATPYQKLVCGWLENSPICEANGLYIVGDPGIGKTTLQKLIMNRYGEQVYVARERGARGEYDLTGLGDFRDEQHKIIMINDLKGKENVKGERSWQPSLIRFLMKLTDGAPLRWNFGVGNFGVTPIVKVIIVSTWEPPNPDKGT